MKCMLDRVGDTNVIGGDFEIGSLTGVVSFELQRIEKCTGFLLETWKVVTSTDKNRTG